MRLVIGIIGILLLINTNVYAQALITPGVPVTSNTSLTLTNGTSFAIPQGRGSIITWQSSFAVAPTSITLQLQFSLDNSSYFSVDTSSSTTGELRYLGPISARFVRCAVTAVNAGAGSGFTCKINVLAFNNTTVASGGSLSSGLGLRTGCGPSTSQGLYFTGDTDTGICGTGVNNLEIYSNNARALLANASGINIPNDLSLGAAGDTRLRRNGAKNLVIDDGAGAAATLSMVGNITTTTTVTAGTNLIAGNVVCPTGTGRGCYFSPNLGTGTHQFGNGTFTKTLDFQSNTAPTCTSNCGTSPTSSGVESSFDIIMGSAGVPASGFVITFAQAWAAAPQCVGSMGTTGMVVGKLPLTLVTTTTTLTVVTNGTAPSVNDRYHFKCSLGQ